jgi:peroxiredoxin
VLIAAHSAFAQTKERFDVGEEAPSFTLRPLNAEVAKAKVVSLENYVGADKIEKKRAVIVAFTSAACEPCKRDIGFFTALSNEYKSKDFLVLLVAIDHDDDALKKVSDLAANADFPVLGDRYNIVAKRYLIGKLPVAYLIDENQKIAKVNLAYDDSAYADMHAALKQLLGVAATDPTPATIAPFLKPAKSGAPIVVVPASQPQAAAVVAAAPVPTKAGKKHLRKKKTAAAEPPPPAEEPKKGPKRVGRSATP